MWIADDSIKFIDRKEIKIPAATNSLFILQVPTQS